MAYIDGDLMGVAVAHDSRGRRRVAGRSVASSVGRAGGPGVGENSQARDSGRRGGLPERDCPATIKMRTLRQSR